MAKRTTTKRIKGGVHQSHIHDSAAKHVAGAAVYIDDIPEPAGTLHAGFGLSERAHARITRMDLSKVRAAPGVVAVLTAKDVPGKNDVAPVIPGDPVFADGLVEYVGQSIFAVAAETVDQARRAAKLAKITYEDLPANITAEAGMKAGTFVLPAHTMKRGHSAKAIKRAKHQLSGRLVIGGQDQFYLEGHIAMAVPQEDGDMLVYSSTQHPSEGQHLVAAVLGRPDNSVIIEIRRMGGGFGGKETQPALYAAIAALLADRTGRTVKARADRDDDMVMTGKRHDFVTDYTVGFDKRGRIEGIEFEMLTRCGMSADLSGAICDRAMFHSDNTYYLPDVKITSHRCKTNTVSNTAFRGFGGPQGMMGIEEVVDEIARHLGRDPLDVREVNLYGGPKGGRNITPYHMKVTDNIAPEIITRLEKTSSYRKRRKAVDAFNATSPVLKKGLALTPVKFGISFTTTHLNQAGALVHVYTDGSVHLNHGGTEMGQGLYIKVAQIVAEEFQIDVGRVKITAANTGKVPNTSATAASSGTDMNGAAARNAARTLRKRMTDFLAEHWDVKKKDIEFRANRVFVEAKKGGKKSARKSMSFAELAKAAYMARVQLSATGFYATPKIHYNRETASGRPFFYFAYGAAVSEVVIDTLTGEYKLLRADILHDCGQSINPAIDIGQIEGGFIQGMGWLTMEELWWDDEGRFRTHAPSTYKIPVASDVPEDFRVEILESGRNREDAIHRSKAVGEPPLMLAMSAYFAIKDAVAAAGEHQASPRLDAPATPERVLFAVEELRQRVQLREAAE